MKIKNRIFLTFVLAISIAVFSSPVLVLANGLPTAGPAGSGTAASNEDCKLVTQPGDEIPSAFPVGKCLKAGEGHNTFVPKDPPNPDAVSPAVQFILKTVSLLVKIIASVALIVFILGALLTVTSEGKEDRLEKGKSAMLYSLIGLIVALFSFIIVAFVQSILF